MLYRFARGLLRLLFLLLFRLEAHGKENVPVSGPLILCGNHRSVFDPPVLGTPLKRELFFMAKEELFRIPIFGYFKPFRRMAVYYGKPVDLSEYTQSTSENLEAATDKIMSEIRAMVAIYQT